MLAFIGGLGTTELVIILLIAVLIFGASKIPEIARSLGKGINEFKKAKKEIVDGIDVTDDDTSKNKKS